MIRHGSVGLQLDRQGEGRARGSAVPGRPEQRGPSQPAPRAGRPRCARRPRRARAARPASRWRRSPARSCSVQGRTTKPCRKQATIVSTHSAWLPSSVSTTSPRRTPRARELGARAPAAARGHLAHRPFPPPAGAVEGDEGTPAGRGGLDDVAGEVHRRARAYPGPVGAGIRRDGARTPFPRAALAAYHARLPLGRGRMPRHSSCFDPPYPASASRQPSSPSRSASTARPAATATAAAPPRSATRAATLDAAPAVRARSSTAAPQEPRDGGDAAGRGARAGARRGRRRRCGPSSFTQPERRAPRAGAAATTRRERSGGRQARRAPPGRSSASAARQARRRPSRRAASRRRRDARRGPVASRSAGEAVARRGGRSPRPCGPATRSRPARPRSPSRAAGPADEAARDPARPGQAAGRARPEAGAGPPKPKPAPPPKAAPPAPAAARRAAAATAPAARQRERQGQRPL